MMILFRPWVTLLRWSPTYKQLAPFKKITSLVGLEKRRKNSLEQLGHVHPSLEELLPGVENCA